MKIGLIDVDGHNFPNLALMKISGYYKAKLGVGKIEWANGFFEYDRIYKSKIFTFTPDDLTAYQCADIRKGGTGYDISGRLETDIENWKVPDYSIYPQYKFSLQFYSPLELLDNLKTEGKA